jgi:hypothetical protein
VQERRSPTAKEGSMLDLVFLALGLAAFTLFGGYAVRLRRL